MAMPTRSARTTEFGEKAPTPATIGPGTYLGPAEPTKARPSLAAFASSQHRSWQESPSAPAGPGPGSYGGSILVAPSENDVLPSYCFESKAPRLAPQYTGSTAFGNSTMVQVPGPGAYDTPASTASGGHHLLKQLKRSAPRSKNNMLGVSKRFNPPSVPRKEQSFGYDVDSRGNLLALPSPSIMRKGTRQDCAGPCDYNPYDKHWWAGVGAAKFSKGLRKTVFDSDCVAKDNLPGPGDYNPKMKPRYHMEMPGSSPFMSSVPKCDDRLQAGPGPGQYAHYSPLGVNSSASNVPCLSSSAQRGAWLRSNECPYSEPEAGNVPGPGAYGRLQDNSSFSPSIRKTLTDEKIGFSSTGKRTSPGPSSHTAGLPGPGDYDLDLQSIAGGLKNKSRIGCKGVFGSSGDRFRIRKRTDDNAKKTPMQLWDQGKILKRVVVLRQTPKSSSSFKSETHRFRSHSDLGAPAMPPATQYVRKDSFDNIVEKGSKSKSKSFLSTSDKREGGAFQLKDAEDIPGPGAYNVDVVKAIPPPRSRAQLNSKLPRGARFGVAGSQSAVGPGSHDIGGSLIKRTFNITFNGAYMPAGAGRVVHSAFHSQHEEWRKGLGSAPSDSSPRKADLFEPAGDKEGLSSQNSYHVPVTA